MFGKKYNLFGSVSSAVLCLGVCSVAHAASLSVTSGQTVTAQTAVSGTDAVTVASGGTISVTNTQGVFLNAAASGAGVTVANRGAIQSANSAAIAAGTSSSGTITITNDGLITSNIGSSIIGGVIHYGGSINTFNATSATNAVVNLDSGSTLTNTNANGFAMALGPGANVVNIQTGATVTGVIDAGSGTSNTLNLSGSGSGILKGQSTTTSGGQYLGTANGSSLPTIGFAGWDNFSTVNVNSGSWQLWGGGYYNTLTVANGATLDILPQTASGPAGAGARDQGLGAGPSGSTNLVINGTVIADTYDSNLYPYNNFHISGSGSLIINGEGWVIQDAPNFTGKVTLNSGAQAVVTGTVGGGVNINSGTTLTIGAQLTAVTGTDQVAVTGTGASGLVNGDIVDNGTLVLNRSDSFTLTGALSGSGSLIKNGDGVATLSGPYSFTGQTTINDGSITISQLQSNGGALVVTGGTVALGSGTQTIGTLSGTGGTVSLPTGSTLVVSSGGNFGGTLSGSGALNMTGTGTLILSGSNTVSGGTQVSNGALQIDGSLTSPVTVASGASVGGQGQIIGQVTIQSGGVFSPGDPVTTSVVGNVSFARGSTYWAQVTPALGGDLIAVTGAVTIEPGASVTVQPLGSATDYARLTKYTIITATQGVTGTFSNVVSTMPLLTPHLTYSADEVQLSLTRNDISFASLAVTPNQARTAAAIEAGGLGSVPYDALVIQTTAGARAAYDALSGEAYGDVATVLLQQSSFSDAVNERLNQPDGERVAWGKVFTEWGRSNDSPATAGVTSSTDGLVVGADATLKGWRLGGVFDYSTDQIGVQSRQSSSIVTTKGVTAYAGRALSMIKLKLGVSYADYEINASRTELFPGFLGNAKAAYGGQSEGAFAEASVDMKVQALVLSPFSELRVSEARTASFVETGNGADLTVSGQKREAGFLTLGARAQAEPIAVGNDAFLSPFASLSWRGAAGELNGGSLAAFTGTGQSFQTAASEISRDAAQLAAGASLAIGGAVKLDLSYTAQESSHWSSQTVKFGAGVRF